MLYTVKYKLKNQWFWRTVKKVRGDFLGTDMPVPCRILTLEDETRIEIPLEGTLFEFSNGRYLTIKKNMEKEANTKIITESNVQ